VSPLARNVTPIPNEDILIFAEMQSRIIPFVVDDVAGPLAIDRKIRYVAAQNLVIEVSLGQLPAEIPGQAEHTVSDSREAMYEDTLLHPLDCWRVEFAVGPPLIDIAE
jgi:hypothetical protein